MNKHYLEFVAICLATAVLLGIVCSWKSPVALAIWVAVVIGILYRRHLDNLYPIPIYDFPLPDRGPGCAFLLIASVAVFVIVTYLIGLLAGVY